MAGLGLGFLPQASVSLTLGLFSGLFWQTPETCSGGRRPWLRTAALDKTLAWMDDSLDIGRWTVIKKFKNKISFTKCFKNNGMLPEP